MLHCRVLFASALRLQTDNQEENELRTLEEKVARYASGYQLKARILRWPALSNGALPVARMLWAEAEGLKVFYNYDTFFKEELLRRRELVNKVTRLHRLVPMEVTFAVADEANLVVKTTEMAYSWIKNNTQGE